jgi:hypothetical protein
MTPLFLQAHARSQGIEYGPAFAYADKISLFQKASG